MSASNPATLDLAEQTARITRMVAETEKFVSEQRKLSAEADKFRRDRFLAPILAAGVLGGAIAAAVPAILRAWGIH